MTANIVPITDNVPALRGKSVNQPPSGARRRTSSLMVIAAVTTTTRISAATQMRTGNYSRPWVRGLAHQSRVARHAPPMGRTSPRDILWLRRMRKRPSRGFVPLYRLRGTQNIYENGELWATNSQYLNDISEMQLGPKAIMGVLLGPPLLAAQPLVERVQAMEATTSSDDDEGQKHLRAEILAARQSIVDDVLKIVGLDGKQFLGADLEVLKDIAEAF